MAKIRLKNPGKPIACILRAIAATLDCRILYSGTHPFPASNEPHIWTFWHNRMFLIPWLRQAVLPGPGAFLTSVSGDGKIIADVCSEFGLTPVRGSSSRRGAQALVELAHWLKGGHGIGVTPDGPRGPSCRVQMGVIKLAQLSGAPLVPTHLRFSRAFQFKTWDQFLLPWPFSRVEIEFSDPFTLPRRLTEEQCESERLRLEKIMRLGARLDIE